ncbi:hypothetical protein [Methylorubrum extorquens]|uniref:hypothetical protein n=1 Tax=Methylorubrum extorquens TaxID=408 RepID=UPI00130124CA|nr:hypothetical protein [Methylorubrum extorquens]
MKLLAAYFRSKAKLFRELGDALVDRRDPAVSKLYGMADEFDQNAAILEDRIAEEMLGKPVQADTPDFH